MPFAIGPIIAAAQAAYAAAVSYTAQALVATGISSILPAGTTYAVAAGTVNFAIQTGASIIIGQAFKPNVPDPEFSKTSRKQTVPPRVSGYGTARIGGDFMLWEAEEEFAYNVVASHDGLINGWTTFYLNDKPVVIVGGFVQPGADDRYGDGTLVRIDSRDGLPTETRYSQIASTSLWPTNARGDGIASLMMIARAGKAEYFLSDYPNGLPIPSGVAELQLCWDARLGARGTIDDDGDKLASATWQWTENPALHLLDYMTNPMTGMGLPIEKFLPRIADWIEAANVCDEPVALAAGGTEPRYRGGGIYLHTTDHADVIATIRSCCDGWLGQDTDGYYTFQAGKYYEPTVIIEDRHIVSARLDRFKKDEESINQVVVTFTDPTFDFSQVETNPIENADEIASSGVIRPQPISLPWVQSSSQAQRLGKAMLYKASAPFSGTITTTLDGLRSWGERRVRIRMPSEGARFADFVADLLPITINPDMTVSIPFTAYVDETYEWSTDEEGAGPGDDTSPDPVAVPVPVISSVVPFLAVAGDTAATRLRITMTATGRTDLSYNVWWRETGSTDWVSQFGLVPTIVMGAPVIETGFVSSELLEVQVSAVTGGGRQSERSTTTNVDARPATGSLRITSAGDFRVTSTGDYRMTG